ncbi:hypothetical protein DS906_20780 [Ruegeria sp. A3M17]|nr:hypothetical protein DS906_20780 [Ruegeria sp. A3M17]
MKVAPARVLEGFCCKVLRTANCLRDPVGVKGAWVYLYGAVDKEGSTLEFMLSERRNGPAATVFFAKALSSNGIPNKIVIDKSSANAAGIREENTILKRFGCQAKVQTNRSKFLNNMIEQYHRSHPTTRPAASLRLPQIRDGAPAATGVALLQTFDH